MDICVLLEIIFSIFIIILSYKNSSNKSVSVIKCIFLNCLIFFYWWLNTMRYATEINMDMRDDLRFVIDMKYYIFGIIMPLFIQFIWILLLLKKKRD